MVSIDTKEELSLYSLEGKWNDYIGVQKEVLTVLREEKFFEENVIINRNTGMVIKINTKGIKETIGTGKRFQKLPRKLKEYKIATLRYLKQIIKSAEIISDDVRNLHEENGYMFAYLGSKVLIDDEVVGVRISIMKKVESNWFWIHHIDENEKVLNYSTHPNG